jgi:ferredoxin
VREPPDNSPAALLRRGLRRAGRAIFDAARQARRPSAEGPPRVHFEGRDEPVDVPAGTTVLLAARRAGVELNHYCGGHCSCGTCRVEVLEGAHNLSSPAGMEPAVLGSSRASAGDRLACQARVLGTVRVRVPPWF